MKHLHRKFFIFIAFHHLHRIFFLCQNHEAESISHLKLSKSPGRWLYNLPPPRRFRSSSLFIAMFLMKFSTRSRRSITMHMASRYWNLKCLVESLIQDQRLYSIKCRPKCWNCSQMVEVGYEEVDLVKDDIKIIDI
ncbi:hypothetical protein P8452_57873 [Trifolium repens]|nr:hypothetical protein P8452_57873 [Trifolium repens]